jgi:hypothetical protein
MLRHYFSVALLNFRKTPFATLANVAVLALGLAAFIVACAGTGCWSRGDRQFASSDRTFVVSSRIQLADGSVVLRETPMTNPHVAGYLAPQAEMTRVRSSSLRPPRPFL